MSDDVNDEDVDELLVLIGLVELLVPGEDTDVVVVLRGWEELVVLLLEVAFGWLRIA